MQYALDKYNKRTWIGNADPSEIYRCPICKAKLIVKNQGSSRTWHFAHKGHECTDTWDYDISPWHRRMQSYFEPKYRDILCRSKSGETHKADILKHDVVVEFQHGPLNEKEYKARNDFFMSLGYKVVWIFDVSKEYEMGNLCWDDTRKDAAWMKWAWPRKTARDSERLSDCNYDFALYLWWDDRTGPGDFVQRIVWSSEDRTGRYDFKKIIVSGTGVLLHKDMDPLDLLRTRTERSTIRKEELGKDISEKKICIQGYSRDSYICPKTNTFGLRYAECVKCDMCRQVDPERGRMRGYTIWCAANAKPLM